MIARKTYSIARIKERRTEERQNALIGKERRAKWYISNTVMTQSADMSREARARVLLQRIVRERIWRREQVSAADEALAHTLEALSVKRKAMLSLRFTSQRARLLQRERAYQMQLSRQEATKPSRARQSRIVELTEEVAARKAEVAAHAHRAAAASQKACMASTGHRDALTCNVSEVSGRHLMPARRPFPVDASPRPTRPGSARPGSAPPGGAPPGGAPPISARPGSARPGSARTLPDSTRVPHPPRGQGPTGQPRTGPLHCHRRAKSSTTAATLDPVNAIALHRSAWVQSSKARAMVEIAAAQALKPGIDRMAAEAAGSGVRAATALARARRACDDPPPTLPERETLDRDTLMWQVLANPRLANPPESSTARIATMWMDQSMATARVKVENAALGRWRAERQAWMRSSGLRRRVLHEEEWRKDTLAARQAREIEALFQRMADWQREDDAALQIQNSFHGRQRRRESQQALATMFEIRGINPRPGDRKRQQAEPNSSEKYKAFSTAAVDLYEVDLDSSRELSVVCGDIEALLEDALHNVDRACTALDSAERWDGGGGQRARGSTIAETVIIENPAHIGRWTAAGLYLV